MPGQGFELDSVGDRELWQVYNQGSDLFASSGMPGVPWAPHTPTDMHFGALPLSATFIFFSGMGTGGFNELIPHSSVR